MPVACTIGMETVFVFDVIDGNTVAISPPWKVGEAQGCLVRIRGLRPEPLSAHRGQIARYKMTLMLLGTRIRVRHEGELDGNVLLCDVFYQGHPLHLHFPELTDYDAISGSPVA